MPPTQACTHILLFFFSLREPSVIQVSLKPVDNAVPFAIRMAHKFSCCNTQAIRRSAEARGNIGPRQLGSKTTDPINVRCHLCVPLRSVRMQAWLHHPGDPVLHSSYESQSMTTWKIQDDRWSSCSKRSSCNKLMRWYFQSMIWIQVAVKSDTKCHRSSISPTLFWYHHCYSNVSQPTFQVLTDPREYLLSLEVKPSVSEYALGSSPDQVKSQSRSEMETKWIRPPTVHKGCLVRLLEGEISDTASAYSGWSSRNTCSGHVENLILWDGFTACSINDELVSQFTLKVGGFVQNLNGFCRQLQCWHETGSFIQGLILYTDPLKMDSR